MKLTGAAILVSRGMEVLQAAPAAYPYRYAAERRMDRVALPLAVTVGLSVLSVAADYFLKLASALPHPFRSWQFAAGTCIFAGSSFGWVYVLQHLKLASVGAVYCVVVVVLLALIGVTVFRESLSASEVLGLICAVAALILLGRLIAP